jgi:hypothetical protein
MALALHLEGWFLARKVKDYATAGRLGHDSRSRISHIMYLLLLAPAIQEQILFLPDIARGRDPIHLRRLQPVTKVLDWSKQRHLWAAIIREELNKSDFQQSKKQVKNCLEDLAKPR